MRSILNAIWRSLLTVVMFPLAVVEELSESSSAPAPVRKAAKRFTDDRQAKLVRRYCRALADGKEPPRIDKLPEVAREWLGRIGNAEAGRVALMSSDDVLEWMNKDGTPQPRNRIPPEFRQRMRRARQEARQAGPPEPASCSELTPRPPSL